MKRPPRRRSGEKDDEPTAPAQRSPAESTRITKEDALEIIRQDWDSRSFKHLDWKAAEGHYITSDQLADAIETNPDQSLPDNVREYLCRFLRGEIKRRPGPQRSDLKRRSVIEFLMAEDYRKELKRLQMERRTGRKDELSPHDRALEIIKERYKKDFGMISTKRLANIISSHN